MKNPKVNLGGGGGRCRVNMRGGWCCFLFSLVLVSCIQNFSLLRCLFETIPVGGVVGVGKQVIIMLTQPQLRLARA